MGAPPAMIPRNATAEIEGFRVVPGSWAWNEVIVRFLRSAGADQAASSLQAGKKRINADQAQKKGSSIK